MDPLSNVRDMAHVAELLKAHDDYVIVPHVSPDPDALGAACALGQLLTAQGKRAVVYTDEAVPSNCLFLNAFYPISNSLPAGDAWKTVFVDGGERHRQPKPVRERETWMNIDHHLDNGQFATHIYVDTAAAATSLIIARLADALGVPLNEGIASCLFTGLLFDTRNAFVTDKCTPEVFNTVARLVEAGARPDHLNRLLNEQMSLGDFKLYGEALAHLKTACDGQVVYTYLSRAMVEACGGTDQAMEMLTLNLPKIAGGEIYALFKESEDGQVKISLRSKGRLAVNEIAKGFDGGGHRFAAGIRLSLPLPEAIAAVIGACERSVLAGIGS